MRSTAVISLLISTLFVHFARAQSNELIIQGQTGKLWLVHAVVAKEGWYSIGRLYNIGPKALATYNSLSIDKPLDIGQQVQIPLTPANFSQTGQQAAGETLLPVYHLVGEKEWMYRVSVDHNKVPIGSLEKWNHIKKDQVGAGMYLVVGFLKVKTALSAFAKEPPPAPVASAAMVNAASTGNPASPAPGNSTASATTAGKTAAPSVNIPSDTTPMTMNRPPVAKNGAPKQEIMQQSAMKVQTANFNGGYFRSDFTDGGKMAIGMAGVFKSTSGWQDGKYYALMNNVSVGTIVKIDLPSNNRSVFAKVLGSLPDMKESAGLVIRISNAAASELDMGDGKVGVEVHY